MSQDKDKKWCVALAVALIDHTFERVGNPSSAENGHFGVTGWMVKHLTFGKGGATIRYIGKSGVKHEKTVNDPILLKALKKAVKGKQGDDALCGGVTAEDVNEYLREFDITAKDLRGYHANREMQERLRAIRSKGSTLPKPRKERDAILKDEFKQALEGAAEAVGHEAATLRTQYLVPGIERAYMKDGSVPRDLTASTHVAAHYRRVPTRSLRLDPTVLAFFKQFAPVFETYPNLWLQGGGARDALMNLYADHSAEYQRASRSMRAIDLVLIGGKPAEKLALLSQFGGRIKSEDLDIHTASLERYFTTRDVGINEVALRPDFMLFTDKAVNDIHRGVVNPSGGKFNPKNQYLSPRVGLRSVLFAIREGLRSSDNPMVSGAVLAAGPFELLLHLYKAFDTGVADAFYAAVRDNPYLRGTRSAEEALLNLSPKVYGFIPTPAQQRTYDDARALGDIDRLDKVASASDDASGDFHPYPYFAYGSNLNPSRIQHRAPNSVPWIGAKAPGYKAQFVNVNGDASDGKMTITPSEGASVRGFLFHIPKDEMSDLDGWEYVPEGHYQRIHIDVHSDEGHVGKAFTYVALSSEGAHPSTDYITTVKDGQRAWDIPLVKRKATKSHAEREDDEAARLIRRTPKLKPSRNDSKRERMEVNDPDIEGRDKDLSLNHKDIG